MSELHGLRIHELNEFRAQGGKVVGTFCLYVPEEIVRAAGAWCLGLCAGAEFAYERVERVMPRNTCPLVSKKKGYELLGNLHDVYVMELPQMKREADLVMWRGEIVRLIEKMEELTGQKVSADSLRTAIKARQWRCLTGSSTTSSRGRAAKYLDINCACFTPNEGRLDDIVRMAREFRADGVIDYSLQFCGLYEMEAHAVDSAVRDAEFPILRAR